MIQQKHMAPPTLTDFHSLKSSLKFYKYFESLDRAGFEAYKIIIYNHFEKLNSKYFITCIVNTQRFSVNLLQYFQFLHYFFNKFISQQAFKE